MELKNDVLEKQLEEAKVIDNPTKDSSKNDSSKNDSSKVNKQKVNKSETDKSEIDKPKTDSSKKTKRKRKKKNEIPQELLDEIPEPSKEEKPEISLEKYLSKPIVKAKDIKSKTYKSEELKVSKTKRTKNKATPIKVGKNKEAEIEFMNNFMDMLDVGKNNQEQRITKLENKFNLLLYILVAWLIFSMLAVVSTSIAALSILYTAQIMLFGALILLVFIK